jgi:hypothetical protein
MITDTINRMMEAKRHPQHPYVKAYWGYYKLGNKKKRIINWFKNIFR